MEKKGIDSYPYIIYYNEKKGSCSELNKVQRSKPKHVCMSLYVSVDYLS